MLRIDYSIPDLWSFGTYPARCETRRAVRHPCSDDSPRTYSENPPIRWVRLAEMSQSGPLDMPYDYFPGLERIGDSCAA